MSAAASGGGASASASSKGKDIKDNDPGLQEIWEKLDTLSGDELRRKYAEFAKQFPKQLGGTKCEEIDPEETEPPKPPLEVPKEGRVKDWGANPDPVKWEVTKTKDDKFGKFKVVDDKGKNVADGFSTEDNANAFIKYYKDTNTAPSDNPGTKPDVPDGPTEGGGEDPTEPEPTPSAGFPIPDGFTTVGAISTAFKHWGRHETNYAAGGSGPSERWDNNEPEIARALNAVGGYEFIIGPEHGERGSDNIGIKFRASNHDDSNGGWYVFYINWEEDGSPGECGVGKEDPHPKTSHLKFNVDGQDTTVENIKDGQKHGILAACVNDASGTPTLMLWYAANPDGKFSSYKYLGKSKDTGNMKPGGPFKEIGTRGDKKQKIQIRIDEIPNARIMNAFAAEVKAPADV